MAAAATLFAACGTSEVPTGAADPVVSPRSTVTPVSAPVVVQAMTAGPNGELLQVTPVYSSCASGVIEVWGGQWQVPVSYTKYCVTITETTPYNGGTVDVWLVNGSTQTHLGHIQANWSKLEFTNIPSGATLRMVAYPNFDPAPGVTFTSWSGANGFSTNPQLFANVFGGEEFLAQLQMPSGSAGGGGSPPSCIICP
jgi:hypothetical protein